MDVKNNIVALLQPLAPAGTELPISNKPRVDEEKSFSNILEEATTKVKQADEKRENQSSDEKQSTQSEEKSQTSKASEETKTSDKKQVNDQESQTVDSTKESSDSLKESSTPQATATKTKDINVSAEETQNAVVQQLQALGLEPEQIQTFLNLFNINETTEVSDDFLEALDTQLNLFQKVSDGEALPAAPVENSNLSSLKAREKLAADFLRSAGIESKEAENLVQKMIQAKTGETVSLDNVATETKTSTSDNSLEALLGFLKKPAAKEISNKEQIVKLEKASVEQQIKQSDNSQVALKVGTQLTENTEIAAPRIQTQDPLAKIFEQVQFQTASTEEGGLKPVMAGFQNPTDNGPFMDLTNAKTSSEFMIQNAAKVNENFSSALNEAKATTSTVSKGLPNGVTEKNVVDQVVQKFSIKGTDNQNEIKIKLDPPALGTVRMNINTSGDSVKTTIIAENQAVKQAIETNMNQLKDSFTSQGMKVESFEVMVGGEPGFKENRQRQSQGGNFGRSNMAGIEQESLEANLAGAYPSRYDVNAGGVSVIV